MNEKSAADELHRLVGSVPVGPPPVAGMLAVRRQRRRSRAVVVLAAAAVLVVATAGVAVTRLGRAGPDPGGPVSSPTVTTSAATSMGWSRIASPPLSARWNTLGAWTGRVVLFIGGTPSTFNGPSSRPDLRDGAAYDPATGTWRSIAEAPVRVGGLDPHAMAGDRLVVVAESGDWLVYDSVEDKWRTVAAPPDPISQPTLSVRGDRVYVLSTYVVESTSPVQVLDLGSGSWSALPPSALTPVLDQRTVVATPAGVVVLGDDLAPREAGNDSATESAEVWDGSTWRRYPASQVMGCCGWQWTGSRIISTYRVTQRHSARGGLYTFRAGALDPTTGTWSQLPFLPAEQDASSWELTAGAGPLVLSNGYLYDDETGASSPVQRPPEAAPAYATAVLTGDRIIVFGGFRNPPGQEPSFGGSSVEPTRDAWVFALDP